MTTDDLEAQRQALAQRVARATSESPLALALRAAEGDTALQERVRAAVDAGWSPPPLANTFVHARPGIVAKWVEQVERDMNGGPCAWCGTKRPRGAGIGPTSAWTTAANRKSCRACAHEIAETGVDDFVIRVFAAAAGMTGFPIQYGVSNVDLFAWECPGEGGAPSAGDGTPWSHLDRDVLRATALRLFGARSLATGRQGFHLPGMPPRDWPAPPPAPPITSVLPTPEEVKAAADKRAVYEAWMDRVFRSKPRINTSPYPADAAR